MNKYTDYVREFQENNEGGLYFIQNQLKKHLETNEENQVEIEHILDFLYSTNKKLTTTGYKTIKEKTDKWTKSLQQVAVKDSEKEGEDYETVLDFKDGFRVIKLLSKNCYKREGKNMSNCVASYYGKDVKVYSLRDSENMPHCTIEKDVQIKGKGNGAIHPKYIAYVVKFLEWSGMEVRESEMKQLGYIDISKLKREIDWRSLGLFKNKYLPDNRLDTIKDKKGGDYTSMKLWDFKSIVEFGGDFKFKLNFDFSRSAAVKTKNASSGDSAKIGSSGDSAKIGSSGNYAQIGSSGNYAQIGSSGYYAKIGSSGYYAQIGSSGYYAKIGSSGNYAQIGSSGYYAKIGSSGYYAKIDSSGKFSACASSGHGTGYRGKIGSWFCLTEWHKEDGEWKPLHMEAFYVDGTKIKEDTWYEMKNKNLVEVK